MDNYMNIVIKAMKQWVTDKFSSWDLAIDNKVDKIKGKGLSTEDYTTEEKEKLASINLEAMLPEVTEDDNGEILAVIDGKWDTKNIPEQKQVDWNQNDLVAKDYIKNRTHWIDNVKGTLIVSAENYDFDEGNVSFDITDYNKELIIDKTYYVIWDGIEYPNLIAFDNDGYPTIGDSYDNVGATYPFSISTYIAHDIIFLGILSSDNSNHSFEIYDSNLFYHQLDEKFIPDTIARIDEIPSPLPEVTEENNGEVLTVVEGEWSTKSIPEQKQADWNQTDETAIDYIKNKPFYITEEAQYKPIFENWTVDVTVNEDGSLYCERLIPDYEDDLLIKGAKYKIIFQCDDNIYEHIAIAQEHFAPIIADREEEMGSINALILTDINLNQNLSITFDSGYFFAAVFYMKDKWEQEINTPNGIGTFTFKRNGFNKDKITISLYQIISEEKKIAQRYTHHANWNENTYNADGYIKNKPLYLLDDAEVLIFDQNIKFVPGEQFSPSRYSFMLDFNKEIDRIVAVWDGVPYLCSPYYLRRFGTLEGLTGVWDCFVLGYIYTSNQLQDFPFHVETYSPIVSELSNVAFAYIGIKQIPADEEEIHNLKLYKISKKWQFDNGLNYALQADWEENSDTMPSFIKNKPMYKTIGTTTTTILTLNDIIYDTPFIASKEINPIGFTLNETYQVKLWTKNNEVLQYDTKAQMLFNQQPLYYLGNTGLTGFGVDTKESFLLLFSVDNVMILGTEEYERIEIMGYEVVYSPLDIRYLPITVQTMAKNYEKIAENSMTQSDWNQTDETAVDYIKNKPEFNSSKISLRDQGNGKLYDIIMYNGELVVRPSGAELVITTLPNKLSYNYDEIFDPAGMVVSLMRTDGSFVDIENYSYEIGVGVGVVPITVKAIYLEDTYTTTFEINITHVDFIFNNNNDGTVSVVSWNGTYNGEPSTYCILPQPYDNFTFII